MLSRSMLLDKEIWVTLYDLAPRILNVQGVIVWRHIMVSMAILLNEKIAPVKDGGSHPVAPLHDSIAPHVVSSSHFESMKMDPLG